ncbi:hypothetical protein Tco_0426044 [Tanacetum coccineum]
MTTLVEHIIVAEAKNRPPMLEKSMYDSWTSLIRLFIKGKKHGRMMLDSIDNGLLVHPTVEENRQTRLKRYSELTEEQKLQDDCDVQVTNIILHGLRPDVYAVVNHYEVAKAIWDKVKLLMKGSELSYQEYECRLYDLFDSKFVTDVKLAKSLYTTTYDQLYPYLSQHECHANEKRIMRERYPDPLALSVIQQFQAEIPQLDSGLDVPMFQQGEDLIEWVNKAMAFYVLFEVPYSDSYPNDMLNQDETQDAGIQDTNSSAPNDLLILSLVEQMTNQVANLDKENQTNKMVNESLSAKLERYKERNKNEKLEAFKQEIDALKETLSNNVKEKESLSTTLNVFKTESKEKESKYIDKEIVLEKQNKELKIIISLGYQNSFHLKKARRIQPTLHDGSVIVKEHAMISVKHSSFSETPVTSHTPVRIEAPSELTKGLGVLNIQKNVFKCLELETELSKKIDCSFFDDIDYELLEDVMNNILGIILELQLCNSSQLVLCSI